MHTYENSLLNVLLLTRFTASPHSRCQFEATSSQRVVLLLVCQSAILWQDKVKFQNNTYHSMISNALTWPHCSHSTLYSAQRQQWHQKLADCCHWQYPYTPWVFPLIPLQSMIIPTLDLFKYNLYSSYQNSGHNHWFYPSVFDNTSSLRKISHYSSSGKS